MAGYGQLRLALAVLRKRSVAGCLENQGDERELLAADHSSHPPAPLGRKGDSTRLEASHPVARRNGCSKRRSACVQPMARDRELPSHPPVPRPFHLHRAVGRDVARFGNDDIVRPHGGPQHPVSVIHPRCVVWRRPLVRKRERAPSLDLRHRIGVRTCEARLRRWGLDMCRVGSTKAASEDGGCRD